MENQNIFGIGATFKGKDVSQDFIANNVVGVGWDYKTAPELKYFIEHITAGDIVYIKSCNFNSSIRVKAIGRIISEKAIDNVLINEQDKIAFGHKVEWLYTQPFSVDKPHEKNNVRSNTLYQEFHPEVREAIKSKISDHNI